ncbi:MAG: F0F1 ATP synthase subunit A [Planctomycetota bacterium]
MTKYMVLELIAAALMLLVFLALARRIRGGGPPKGLFWNFFEVMLVFIRDEVARPSIGRRDADKFLPFLWNIFFFILFCNLLGILPWAGSPTGALTVTAALAGITLCAVVGTGIQKFGVGGFFKSLVPHMELPKAIALPLIMMIFVIELVGLLIRHVVLAVRLLANMFAGHLVLAVILGFIATSANYFFLAWLGITTASVLGSAALTLLELFVAFLQAYIFTFLSALFIGMAVHPH